MEPNDIMNNFGERLQNELDISKISIYQMADVCKCSENYIYRLLKFSDTPRISSEILIRMADYFGVRPQYLLWGEMPRVAPCKLSEEEDLLIGAWRGVSSEVRRIILELLQLYNK